MVFAAALLVFHAAADPILPFQQPIADQIQVDLTASPGDATLTRAQKTYDRTSKSLSGDISILRDLNSLLGTITNYPALLSDAANLYQADFQGRSAEMAEQLRPAPRSSTKTSAQNLLHKVDTALANAVAAASTTERIKHLGTAAGKFPQTSNTIQRAIKVKPGFSSMVATVGSIKFNSKNGFVLGGTNFQGDVGTTVGEFSPTNDCGCLAVGGVDNGNVTRSILLIVHGISTNAPVTYPLGGNNVAFYRAADRTDNREYDFQSDPSLTNSLVTNAFLTIDYIGTNYVLGRFAFIATNAPFVSTDTNTSASIYNGEFQLNFRH
jgi:hypothetical protein